MVIDIIPITDGQRKEVHELLDAVLDACAKGEKHIFFLDRKCRQSFTGLHIIR